MSLAYGTVLTRYATIEEAQAAAVAKHSHYYTDPVGWVFRAEVVRYSYTIDADREWYGTTDGAVEIFAFPVRRFTPNGATIQNLWSGAREKWTDLRPGAKQWASRTAREALEQLAERRRRQLWVLNRKVQRAEYDMKLAKRALEEPPQETVL